MEKYNGNVKSCNQLIIENVLSLATESLTDNIEQENPENEFSDIINDETICKENTDNSSQLTFVELDVKKNYNHFYDEHNNEDNEINFPISPNSIKKETLFNSIESNSDGTHLHTSNYEENKKTSKSYSSRISKHKKKECKFCDLRTTNLSRHCRRKHFAEKDVQECLSYPVRSSERKQLLLRLEKPRKFLEFNNTKSDSYKLETGKLSCAYCSKFFTKRSLIRHIKSCALKNITGKYEFSSSPSQFLLPIEQGTTDTVSNLQVIDKVFPVMKVNIISLIAQTDLLITYFGENFLNEHPEQYLSCSARMRDLARLLLYSRNELQNKSLSLFDMLDSNYTDIVLNSLRNFGYNKETVLLRVASTLRHVADFCIYLLSIECPQFLCDNVNCKVKSITKLTDSVTSYLLEETNNMAVKIKTLEVKPSTNQCVTVLSLTDCFRNFFFSVIEKVEKHIEILEHNSRNIEAYCMVIESALVLTCLYNRGQTRNVQLVKLERYVQDCVPVNQNIQSDSPINMELLLTQQCTKLETIHNNSQTSVILFPKNVQNYLKFINKIRKTTEIVSPQNTFLFAHPKHEHSWLVANNVIRKAVRESNVANAAVINNCELRNKISTLMRLLNLTIEEASLVAKHMGFAEKTCNQFYQLLQNINELAKVSVLVDTIDNIVNDIKDKELNDLSVDVNDILTNEVDQSTGCKRKLDHCNIIGKKYMRYYPWTREQIDVLKEHFSHYMYTKNEPSKTECIKFKEKYSFLFKNINWVKIKAQVYNQRKKLESMVKTKDLIWCRKNTIPSDYIKSFDNQKIDNHFLYSAYVKDEEALEKIGFSDENNENIYQNGNCFSEPVTKLMYENDCSNLKLNIDKYETKIDTNLRSSVDKCEIEFDKKCINLNTTRLSAGTVNENISSKISDTFNIYNENCKSSIKSETIESSIPLSTNFENQEKIIHVSSHEILSKNTIWVKVETILYENDSNQEPDKLHYYFKENSKPIKTQINWVKIEAAIPDTFFCDTSNDKYNKDVKISAQIFNEPKIPQPTDAISDLRQVKLQAHVFDEPTYIPILLQNQTLSSVNCNGIEKNTVNVTNSHSLEQSIPLIKCEPNNDDYSEQSDSNYSEYGSPVRKSRSVYSEVASENKQRIRRIAWTEKQARVVKKYFARFIEAKREPGKKECLKLKSKYPDLFKNKDWVKIKAYVYNEHKKLSYINSSNY